MNPELDIATIMTTQNDLRNVWQIRRMIDYIEAGGFFTSVDLQRYEDMKGGQERPSMISLSRFPDDILMAHDGHHRLVSMYLGGRRLLRGDEYRVKEFSYLDYTEPNLANGWMTPFDPITEIRLCEFGPFKREVGRLMKETPDLALPYILTNKHLYSATRDIDFIPQLAEKIFSRLSYDNSPEHGSGFCLSRRW
jgi:hypothetical protein